MLDFVLLIAYLLGGVLAAFIGKRYLDFKDEKVLAALFIAVPVLAMLATGKLTKVSAFGVEATIEKVRNQRIGDSTLVQQSMKPAVEFAKASAESGKVKMQDGFFGLRKEIAVLDMDTDLVAALQPPPDYELDIPQECFASRLAGEDKARVNRLAQASHTLASALQASLQNEAFAGVAVVQKGVLKAYFAPTRFQNLAGLQLWYTHRGIQPPRLPCSLVYPLSQSLVWQLLADLPSVLEGGDKVHPVSDRSKVGEVLQRLQSDGTHRLALVAADGTFKGILSRSDIALSVLSELLNSD